MKRIPLSQRMGESGDCKKHLFDSLSVNQAEYFPVLEQMLGDEGCYQIRAEKFRIIMPGPLQPLIFLVSNIADFPRKKTEPVPPSISVEEFPPPVVASGLLCPPWDDDDLAAYEAAEKAALRVAPVELASDKALNDVVQLLDDVWPEAEVTEATVKPSMFDCEASEWLYELMIEPFARLACR